MSNADVLFEAGLAAEYSENARPDPGCEVHASELPPIGEHYFSEHVPLWNWVNPVLRSPFARERGHSVLFDRLEPGLSPAEYGSHTNFFIFIGAASSEALNFALSRQDIFVLVFEPDCARFRAHAESLDPTAQAQANVLYFSGDFRELMPFISEKLTRTVNQHLYPIFFIRSGYEQVYSGFIKSVIEQIEILYYRACIYPIEGHWGANSLPLRDITRDLFYDQLKHLYENLCSYPVCPNLDALEGLLSGRSAVLIAPGPDLDSRIEYVKECEKRGAVLIAVTRALPTLLKYGIEPHFALINDNSIEAGVQVMDTLPEMGRTVLIAQCLSPIGKGAFRKTYFFGNILQDIFPKRADLRLHGSVITTCYSLAAFLGCRECFLVGAQLAGHDRESWKLSYSRSSDLQDRNRRVDKPEGQWPYLYPVVSHSGLEMYTTINFLDAAIWFREEIRRVGLSVINTTDESIIFGEGITISRDRLPAPCDSPDAVLAGLNHAGGGGSLADVENFIASQTRMWTNTRKASEKMCRMLSETGEVEEPLELLETFDRNNTSYLLERYKTTSTMMYRDVLGRTEVEFPPGTPFGTRSFYDAMFDPESETARRAVRWSRGELKDPRASTLHYYFSMCADMAASLAMVLSSRRRKIRALRREAEKIQPG